MSFQDEGNVFLLSLGTIHNCLRHPDVIPIVKRMDIVHHITPFLEKKSKDQSKDYFPHLQSIGAPAVSPMHAWPSSSEASGPVLRIVMSEVRSGHEIESEIG